MILKHKCASRTTTLALLAASVAIVPPVQARNRLATSAPPVADVQTDPSLPPAVVVSVPLTPAGRLEPLPRRVPLLAAGRSRPPRSSPAPQDRVGAANRAARIEPERTGFVNAIQQYPYTEGALYQVYAKPGQVTDIALQEGEQLVGSGPVAAGDTVRWIIGDTASGSGAASRVHILVKPVRPDIVTNLVINTDRRTYHLELRANPSVYMASVSWIYPQDELIALRARRAEAERATPVAAGMDLASLNFGYAIEGDKPAWRPLRAFDDGTRVFVEFPESVAQGELPPLFVVGPKGEAELVNYRVAGRYMIVDRLFARAELRLGWRKGQDKVRIIASRRGRS
ncbi:MAG: P-type conjugative transfer protein TrbG [Novosphingobium sp.]|nr:P-type conjugative transfer protein TrbG [Novosphingobium sp.]